MLRLQLITPRLPLPTRHSYLPHWSCPPLVSRIGSQPSLNCSPLTPPSRLSQSVISHLPLTLNQVGDCVHVTVQTGLFESTGVPLLCMCVHYIRMTEYVCIPVCRYRCSMELGVGVHTTYRHRMLYVSCTGMTFSTFTACVTVTLSPVIM